VNYEGDSFFVAFPSASLAVSAAAEAQRALAAQRWPDALPLRVRIGIHTGTPTPAPPKYVGLDVHQAARVMAAAHGGQVLVTQTTRDLNDSPGSRTAFRDLGEHELRDIPSPTHLYQLDLDGLETDFPPPRTVANRPTNLPAPVHALIGRTAELAVLDDLLTDPQVRLVTLAGAGGTGKTRLALEAAEQAREHFPGGVFLVRLTPVRDGSLLQDTIARVLHVRPRGSEPLLETLADYLSGHELLLVLDNFEQISEAAPTLAELLERAPKLKLLVTSRVRLRVGAERLVRLAPLPLPPADADAETLEQFPASALFLERVRAADPEFRLDSSQAAAVTELCARLDGLPLALELAAARTALLSPRELLARLSRRLDALGSAGADTDERQRTLRATLAWSHDLLGEPEQQLYRTLAVFPDGWVLEAAEAVAGAELDAMFALEGLVDSNLVNRRRLDDGSARFWMYETIRDDALERLQEQDGEQLARERLFDHVCALAEREAGDYGATLSWLGQVRDEQGMIRAALNFGLASGQTARSLSLWDAIALSWREIAPAELAGWGERLEQETRTERTTERLLLLRGLIDVAGRSGPLQLLRGRAEEALELAREIGDPDLIAGGLMIAGWCDYGRDPERAVTLAGEAAELSRPTGSQVICQVLNNRIVFALAADMREQALEDAAELLALARQRDFFVCVALSTASVVALRHGDLEQAVVFAEEARAMEAQTPSPGVQALACDALGLTRVFAGEERAALPELARAYRLFGDGGYEHDANWVLYALAAATAGTDPERALVLAAAAGPLEEIIDGVPEWRVEAEALTPRLEQAAAAVDEQARQRLDAIGRGMSREELAGYAQLMPAAPAASSLTPTGPA
jgi:predicted ATPase